ncbi:hypothetical protein QPM04_07060, partial [Massilia varians]
MPLSVVDALGRFPSTAQLLQLGYVNSNFSLCTKLQIMFANVTVYAYFVCLVLDSIKSSPEAANKKGSSRFAGERILDF